MKRGNDLTNAKHDSAYRVQEKQNLGYWQGKTPCWEMLHCPETMRKQCPVFQHLTTPGWEVGGLYCQLFDSRQMGVFTDVCRLCRVYKKWGRGELNERPSSN